MIIYSEIKRRLRNIWWELTGNYSLYDLVEHTDMTSAFWDTENDVEFGEFYVYTVRFVTYDKNEFEQLKEKMDKVIW